MASSSPDQIALVCDVSKPPLPLQAVAAWHAWRFQYFTLPHILQQIPIGISPYSTQIPIGMLNFNIYFNCKKKITIYFYFKNNIYNIYINI